MKFIENNTYIINYIDYFTREFCSITFILRPDSAFYPFVNKVLNIDTILFNRLYILSITNISKHILVPITNIRNTDFNPVTILPNIERLNFSNDSEYFQSKFPKLNTQIDEVFTNPPYTKNVSAIDNSGIDIDEILRLIEEFEPKTPSRCPICDSKLQNGLCPDCYKF